MTVKLAPLARMQFTDDDGAPLSGGTITFYQAGTTTLQNTYTDSTGGVANANPITLNTLGQPPYGIWLTAGLSYKYLLKDASGATIYTEDGITGINDASVALDEWVTSGVTPTYVNATTFTLPGDQTSAFHVGRRLKFTIGAGTVYGRIATSAYGALTTVTLTMDGAQTLDSGLSAVLLSILRNDVLTVPQRIATASGTDTYTASVGATRLVSGDEFRIKIPNASTSPTPTLNIDSLGAKTIKTPSGGALVPGQLNGEHTFRFNGTDMIVLNPLSSLPSPASNLIINPSGLFNSRVAGSGIADDTYDFDRWYTLTQTGTIAVSQVTDAENGTPSMMRSTQSQASAQRMGRAQIIEGKFCRHLRGQPVVLNFGRLRLSSAANIRIALLEWTGTEDAVTSDVVNDWTSGTYTAGNFFLGSNVTINTVVQQALSANTLTDATAIVATLGVSFTNLIAFVWTEGAVAQNVTLDVAKVDLRAGSAAVPFVPRTPGEDLALCQRYVNKTFNQTTAPAQNIGTNTGEFIFAGITASQLAQGCWSMPQRMRAVPTVTLYNPAAANAEARNETIGADCSSTTAARRGEQTISIQTTTSGGAGNGNMLGIHIFAEAEL